MVQKTVRREKFSLQQTKLSSIVQLDISAKKQLLIFSIG